MRRIQTLISKIKETVTFQHSCTCEAGHCCFVTPSCSLLTQRQAHDSTAQGFTPDPPSRRWWRRASYFFAGRESVRGQPRNTPRADHSIDAPYESFPALGTCPRPGRMQGSRLGHPPDSTCLEPAARRNSLWDGASQLPCPPLASILPVQDAHPHSPKWHRIFSHSRKKCAFLHAPPLSSALLQSGLGHLPVELHGGGSTRLVPRAKSSRYSRIPWTWMTLGAWLPAP